MTWRTDKPDKRDEYIVTVGDPQREGDYPYTDTDTWTGAGWWSYGNAVSAWMPFPAPWKGEEHEQ